MQYSQLIDGATYLFNGIHYTLADKPNLCFINPDNRIYFFSREDISKLTLISY